MEIDIRTWLESVGQSRYADAFVFHDVGHDVLADLTDDHLRELGVSLGDRLRLLRAIALEGAGTSPVQPPVQPRVEPPVQTPVQNLPVAAAMPAAPIPQQSNESERRPLTVMFVDLADSTALSTRLDPEDLQDVIRGYQETCTKVVQSYDGFVAKYMGDGVLVYFGYPISLDRNAERAVRSALGIVEAMALLNGSLGSDKGVEIAVRIGIATGTVMVGELVGEGAAQERTVIGEAPNMAARLQGLAGRNGIVISALTCELAGDDFVYEDMGTHELKGIGGAVPVWGVAGLRSDGGGGARTPDNDAPDTAPRLVGRDEEIGLLHRAWQSARDEGRGQAVSISGEAGIGKSALCEGLRSEVRAEGCPQIPLRCSPYHSASALHPVIEHYKRLAAWQPEDDADARLAKLEAALRPYEAPLAESVPLLASLLSLPLPPDRYPDLTAAPQMVHQQIQDIIIAMILQQAERQPLLALWEDLHWADPSTLELLGLLIDQAPTAALLIVTTSRPEFVAPWAARSHLTPITLNRLERPHAEALIARIAGPRALPPEVVDHIVVKTDGVPLYVEELTKTILASDILRVVGDRLELSGPLSSLSIPDTLQASLMARLDRLPQGRELVQSCSVLGRDFAYEMILGLSQVPEDVLRDGLDRLVEAELLYQRGRPPRARYIFKHALIQDAAYQSLLRRARQHVHQQAAELLEASFPEIVADSPEIVARHYDEAGAGEKAIEFWQRAAQRSAKRFAHHETISHLRNVRILLSKLAATPERTSQSAGAQIGIAGALLWTAGPGAKEVGDAYAEAVSLCAGIDDDQMLGRALLGSMGNFKMRGEWARAEKIARQLLDIAKASGRPGDLLAAHVSLGECFAWQGNLAEAHEQIESAVEIEAMISTGATPTPASPWSRVATHVYRAWLWMMEGREADCRAAIRQALALSDELGHPFSRVFALHFSSHICLLLHRPEEALAHAEAQAALATEQQFMAHISGAKIYSGLAHSMIDPACDTTADVDDGVTGWRESGGETALSTYEALAADALARLGRVDEAWILAQVARDRMEASDERVFEAEVFRIYANVALARHDPDRHAVAQDALTHAIDIARSQGARLFELRTSVDLARLLQAQGCVEQARDLLAVLVSEVGDDADAVDVGEARTLLAELT